MDAVHVIVWEVAKHVDSMLTSNAGLWPFCTMLHARRAASSGKRSRYVPQYWDKAAKWVLLGPSTAAYVLPARSAHCCWQYTWPAICSGCCAGSNTRRQS